MGWRLASWGEAIPVDPQMTISGLQPPPSFPPLPSFRRRPESRRAGRSVRPIALVGLAGDNLCGRSRLAGMDCIDHWIPRPSFQTRLYHPALAGAPPEEENWSRLGGLFPTPLYHLHPCKRASMQASFRWNDNGGIPACAGMTGRGDPRFRWAVTGGHRAGRWRAVWVWPLARQGGARGLPVAGRQAG